MFLESEIVLPFISSRIFRGCNLPVEIVLAISAYTVNEIISRSRARAFRNSNLRLFTRTLIGT